MPFSACKGKRTSSLVQPLCAFFYTGNSRPLLKGRDSVNRFKKSKEMLGEVNGKELGVAFVEFIELARAIRGKLGCRKYLLDQYLLHLLEMARNFSYLDLSDDGEETGGKLRKLCRQVLREEDAVAETRIGSTVQAYVATHPYPFLEDYTKVELYMAELADLYFEHAAERYAEEQENRLLGECDPLRGNELYNMIVQLIGGETEMEQLNALFAQRFLLVKPMELFTQSYVQDFICALTYRDMQTDHTVLQLLLDRVEESGDAVSV